MSKQIRRLAVHDGPWLEENPPLPTVPPPVSDEEQEALWWHWQAVQDDLDRDRWGFEEEYDQ